MSPKNLSREPRWGKQERWGGGFLASRLPCGRSTDADVNGYVVQSYIEQHQDAAELKLL
jgi:hypothetical protein